MSLFNRMSPFSKEGQKVSEKVRDAAIIEQQSGKGGLAIVTGQSNPTAYSPAAVGLGVVQFGQTLPMGDAVRITVSSDAATGAGNALLLGHAGIATLAGAATSSSIIVTAGSGNGTVGEFALLQNRLCYNTMQFSNVQVTTRASAAAAGASLNNFRSALELDIIKYSNNLAGTKSETNVNVDVALNEFASNPNYSVARPTLSLNQGTLGPDSCYVVGSFPINVVAKYTFNIVAGTVGQIYA